MLAGEATVGAIPTPLRVAVFGLSGPLVVTVSEPAGTGPKLVGVNVTEITHFAPAASVLPHVVEATENSADGVIDTIVSGVVW
jgi:hypothetical protein